MSSLPSISGLPPAHISMDYARLREAGMRYLERMAGPLWTDFNAHDPGITMLEVLCYAITDLGYRASLPVEDLLSDGEPASLRRHFLTAARALPLAPVTELDYRKLLLDIPGVQNVWLKRNETVSFTVDCTEEKIVSGTVPAHHQPASFVLNGLLDILFQPHENATPAQVTAISKAIRKVYHNNRNLCNDLGEIGSIPTHDIRVCADIELHPDAFIEQVYARIHYDLQQHFNPPLRRYTVGEMLEKGVPVEQIYEGPLLSGGFVDTAELNRSTLKTSLRLSDIIRVIMDVPGVKLIRKIHFNDCDAPLPENNVPGEENWTLTVKPGHLPNLCEEKSRMKFYKGLLPFEVDLELIEIEKQKILDAGNAQSLLIADADKDLPSPETTFVDPGDYISIQHDLPKAYGVGASGLPLVPETERVQRMAQARQLRAYLLFFDQILADFLAQLASVRVMFEADASLGQTYFNRVIDDLPEIADAYRDYPNLSDRLRSANAEDNAGDPENALFYKRKNRLLDHIMARFCESFNDYVLLMATLSRKRKSAQSILQDKTAFIREHEWLSQRRYHAFDFFNEFYIDPAGENLKDDQNQPIPKLLWYDTGDLQPEPQMANISGIEHRMSRLAGIPNILRRNLSKIFYDFYEEFDTDENGEIRFRVVDVDHSKILLSGSRHYPTKAEAVEELRTAVRLAAHEENYQLLTADDGRFYFNIIDLANGGEVTARRIEYFTTEELRAEAVAYLTGFMREKFSEEGIFMVEHLLLRPRKQTDNFLPVCCHSECADCGPIDPYSHRVHIVLPGYSPRFSDMDFRNFFERLLRMELPAHLLPAICWIGKDQMGAFESRYRAWLETLQKYANGKSVPQTDQTLNQFLEILGELYTIYPQGVLHDCEDEGDEQVPVILGRTHLGTISDNTVES